MSEVKVRHGQCEKLVSSKGLEVRRPRNQEYVLLQMDRKVCPRNHEGDGSARFTFTLRAVIAVTFRFPKYKYPGTSSPQLSKPAQELLAKSSMRCGTLRKVLLKSLSSIS